MINFSWILSRYYGSRGLGLGGITEHGPEWKRVRNFVQTNLLFSGISTTLAASGA